MDNRGLLNPWLGLSLLSMAALATLGCGSTLKPQERLAKESLDSGRTWGSLAPRGEQEITFDLETVDLMRERLSDRNRELLAVIHLPLGMHPFRVYAFSENEGRTLLNLTDISWGKVYRKAQWAVPDDGLEQLLSLAKAGSDCTDTPETQEPGNTFVVFWVSESRVLCSSGWHPYLGDPEDTDEVESILNWIDDLTQRSDLLRRWAPASLNR